MLTHTAKVEIPSKQYRDIKLQRKRYSETTLHKQYGGQGTEASELVNKSQKGVDEDQIILTDPIKNMEAVKKCNGLLEGQSNSCLRPSSSQEVDKMFVSKGIARTLKYFYPILFYNIHILLISMA